MKIIVEGTEQEIEELKLLDSLYCGFFVDCNDCRFNSKDKCGNITCDLVERTAIDFIKKYAEFKAVEDDKSIDNDTKMPESQEKIVRILEAIKQLLLTKNSRYGNSILEPMRVFSKKDKEESDIPARLDDKLSRIKNSDKIRINDVTDLIGYLVLLLIQLGCTETDILNQID